MALKRQQAVEDAIALRLASNESGASLEVLPPGKIFGMNVTEPCVSPNKNQSEPEKSKPSKSSVGFRTFNKCCVIIYRLVAASPQPIVSESAIDMLAQLFPHRKRSVLELVLRRCDLDLLRAIEQCGPTPSAFRPPTSKVLLYLINEVARNLFTVLLQSQPITIHSQSTQPLQTQSHFGPVFAYPKWLLPMSIPVTMGHLPNLAPRCTQENCPMCIHSMAV